MAAKKPPAKKSAVKKVSPITGRTGPGRKSFVPTAKDRKLVEKSSGWGIPQEEIACLVGEGISVDTMQKYFAHEIRIGKARANSRVGRTFHARACKGEVAAAIWWTKTRMGWKDTSRLEVTGADGVPLKHVVEFIDAKKVKG